MTYYTLRGQPYSIHEENDDVVIKIGQMDGFKKDSLTFELYERCFYLYTKNPRKCISSSIIHDKYDVKDIRVSLNESEGNLYIYLKKNHNYKKPIIINIE